MCLGGSSKIPPDKKCYQDTPWKINMDHNNGGLVQIMFLSKWVMAVGEPAVNLPGVQRDVPLFWGGFSGFGCL